MIGLSSHTTFDLEDFGYIVLQPEDRDNTTRALLARKLDTFTERLSRVPAIQGVLQRYGHAVDAEAVVNPGVFLRVPEILATSFPEILATWS